MTRDCGNAHRFHSVPTTEPWVPHISLVFREMWDTTNPDPFLSER
jgi:hypothetical protein